MDSANCYAFCPVGPVKSLPLSSSDRQCLYSIIIASMATNDAASMLFHVSTGRDCTAPRFVGWLSERLHASTNTVPVGQDALDLCTLHWKQVLSPACHVALLFCIKGKVR